ncbi:AAA family ATPase [Variovorax sp. dw_308]|uniref:AAA family ATPase n=1 Tax=Variovorax sp. dw_308 TaxID=2721546 RepID=UPI001C4372AD|nr:ATP-binding protein [Variovorax sp. dw_308]
MTPTLPAGSVIALLGAGSTGKTELAQALATRLQQRGIASTWVPEPLREWCMREGRAPRRDELQAIADEQTRRIVEAARSGVVVADTTALSIAVYSDTLFGDTSLYPGATAAQCRYTITLLTALDLPWVDDGLQREGPQVREPFDGRLRGALAGAGIGYAVVHGTGAERLASAWNAIHSIASRERPTGAPVRRGAGSAWQWPCDKCSDPSCEHRLFSGLVAGRQ